MENKFYIDDFEKFLKDKVDDFKMYPSHRVWHSIYNNMHPGSRWPSISMCITLICTLFLVGYLNTGNNSKKTNRQLATKTEEQLASQNIAVVSQKNQVEISDAVANIPANKPAFQLGTNKSFQSRATLNNKADNLITAESYLSSTSQASTPKNAKLLNSVGAQPRNDLSSPITNASVANSFIITNTETIENTSEVSINNELVPNTMVNNLLPAGTLKKSVAQVSKFEKPSSFQQPSSTIALSDISKSLTKNTKPTAKTELSETDKSWMENYAMYNRPAPKKWKGRLSMQLYFTPSVVYRDIKNTAGKSASSMLTSVTNSSDIASFVTHTPSFGLETGTSLVYDLFKNIRIKAGVQLNYTRYNVHAYNNYHPSLTTLTMNNENGMSYATYRSSPYANFYGADGVKLHSETYQLSLPAGVDLRLASIDNNIDWYAGATLQPTFVFGGSSYLLSSDTRSYVPTTEFMNHFNLNTGIETFLSIKTKSGYTWNIGPQLRRQVFSSNNKIYTVQERLVSYGIKLGISKKL